MLDNFPVSEPTKDACCSFSLLTGPLTTDLVKHEMKYLQIPDVDHYFRLDRLHSLWCNIIQTEHGLSLKYF